MATITQTQIVNYMKRAVSDHVDPHTGEVNTTKLGEDAIDRFRLSDQQAEELDIFYLSYQVARKHEGETPSEM